MPITSSNVIEDIRQKDGRRAVRERHVDHLGIPYYAAYLAAAGADLLTVMATRAAQIDADLTAGEIATNLAAVMAAPTTGIVRFNYSTAAQNIAAVRTAFASLTDWQVCKLGKYIQLQNLSDVQLQNIFGVSAGAQLTALKNRLTTLASDYDLVIVQVGQ